MSSEHRAPKPDSRLKKIALRAGLVAAALAFAWQLLGIWRTSFPSPPAQLALEVVFPVGIAGKAEPLVTTGVTGDGDFLAVRYLDETTAVLIYDVWGIGGPTSAPFALRAGERRSLQLEMPTLPRVDGVARREKRPLRVALDDQVLLQEPAYFHRRRAHELYFGTNPLGGTLAAPHFRGTLALAGTGRVLRGGPQSLFSAPERVFWILRTRALGIALALLLSAAMGFAATWLIIRCARLRIPQFWAHAPGPAFPMRTRAPHRWFLATAAVCTLLFAAMLTSGRFNLITADSFGNFYDYQAAAWLQGRWDVPEPALSGEAFVFEGKIYGYFGPTPALLRLPLVALGVAFGQLTRLYMLGYYVAILAAAYALLVHIARIGSPTTATPNWPSAFSVVLFVATVGLGTTLFFLGSRAYVYHEAILCGAAFALWSGYFSLRFLAEPQHPWWLPALLCGVLSIHARPPSGLFALCLLGCACIWVAWRALRAERTIDVIRRPFLIAVIAALGIFSFHGVSYLKFRSFDGAPLRYHVQYHPARIANIEGKNFHLSNFAFNFATYFWHPTITLRPQFPYVYISGPQPRYPAKMDVAEPTAALPYAMPALFLLAVVGGAFAFIAWPGSRAPLGVIAVAAAPMTLALLTAVAVSHRYTSDFCPMLILAGAFGLHAWQIAAPAWRRAAHTALAALCIVSALITLPITLHYQGEGVWGVPDDVRATYRTLRKSVDSFFGIRNPESSP